MALVTLAVAKVHIRADWQATSPPDARDAELQLKVDQAADIILSYLKGRRLSVSTLTSSAGVATVTTAIPHGLTTGATVTVIGATQPEYNGLVTVTVLTTTTFTYAVSGTPAATATGGFAIVATSTWTDLTVPARVQAAVLLMTAHLWEGRGDDSETDDEILWQAVERLLVRDRDPALA